MIFQIQQKKASSVDFYSADNLYIKLYCMFYLRANIHEYNAFNMMAYITPKQLLLINAYKAEYIFNLQTMDYKFILNSTTTPQCVFSKKGKHYLKVHTHVQTHAILFVTIQILNVLDKSIHYCYNSFSMTLGCMLCHHDAEFLNHSDTLCILQIFPLVINNNTFYSSLYFHQ